MIFEQIDLDFSWQILRSELAFIQKTLPPVMISEDFGGWSITSSNGSYRDGWLSGDDFAAHNIGADFEIKEILSRKGFKPLNHYKVPTEACLTECRKLIDKLESQGLYPRRARFMLLKSGAESNYHRDCPENMYAVRLHIPIQTNQGCFFICEEGRAHLNEGEAYLLRVNRLHKVVNLGSEDRVHFVCDVFDTKGISEHHRFSENISTRLRE